MFANALDILASSPILSGVTDHRRRLARLLQDSRRPTILVTGGAGFLGSHLCDRLIERGDDVL